MSGVKAFILAPFILVKESWAEGPLMQWLVLAVISVLIGTIWFTGNEIKHHMEHATIATGVAVDKWYEPEHQQWAGKFYVTVPNRFHIVIRGKNFFGNVTTRDLVVMPEEFERYKVGETYKVNN